MPAISLDRVDTAPIEYAGMVVDDQGEQVNSAANFTDFSPEFKRWLANFVDVFNQNMQTLEDVIGPL